MAGVGSGRMSPAAAQIYSSYMVQRPQSQAGNYDAPTSPGPRPESRMSGLGGSPGSPTPDGAFEYVQDFAKLNGPQHQATRSDTFYTPSRLESRMERRGQSARQDGKAMLDIFEHGFSKTVEKLGKGIMEEVRGELRQTLMMLRKDVSDSLTSFVETREAAENAVISQVLDKVSDLGRQQVQMRESILLEQQPMMTEMQKIHKYIMEENDRQLENERTLVQRIQTHLADSFEKVSGEVKEARIHQQKEWSTEMALLREEFDRVREEESSSRQVISRMEQLVESMIVEEGKIRADSATTFELVQKVQEASDQHFAELVPIIKDQAERLKAEIDFSPVLSKIEVIASAVNGDMGTLEEVLGEIGKVQKALYIDFVQKKSKTPKVGGGSASPPSLENKDKAGGDGEAQTSTSFVEISEELAVQEGIRVRDFYTQTDVIETELKEIQTDPVVVEDAMARKRSEHNQKPVKRNSIVKPETELMKKKRPKNVIDGDAMKQQMREALIKGEYNVADYYHTSGCAQWIARSWLFEQVTFLVIFLNGIWIAIEADHNNETILFDAHAVFQIVENCFCTFFSIELAIRFMAFKVKLHAFKDFWFTFDLCLVTLMILETWVITAIVAALQNEGGSNALQNFSMLRMARIVKLFRMARMARILRMVPELVVLIKTIGVASRSVFFFFLFWLIIIFMFGVGFRQITKGSEIGDKYFDSVPGAMNSLLLDGLLPANSAFVNELSDANPVLWPFIIMFILLASLTIMNMLIGVLVEVVGVVASTEKEKMSVLGVKHDMHDAMEFLGVNVEKPLSQDQFVSLLMHSEMLNVIQGIGVDPFALVDATEYIYSDLDKEAEANGLRQSPGLTFENFIDILLKMRGKNPATVKDVKEHTRYMKSMFGRIEDLLRIRFKKVAKDLHVVLQHMNEDSQDQDSNTVYSMATKDNFSHTFPEWAMRLDDDDGGSKLFRRNSYESDEGGEVTKPTPNSGSMNSSTLGVHRGQQDTRSRPRSTSGSPTTSRPYGSEEIESSEADEP